MSLPSFGGFSAEHSDAVGCDSKALPNTLWRCDWPMNDQLRVIFSRFLLEKGVCLELTPSTIWHLGREEGHLVGG